MKISGLGYESNDTRVRNDLPCLITRTATIDHQWSPGLRPAVRQAIRGPNPPHDGPVSCFDP
jgi:hypothetical protein